MTKNLPDPDGPLSDVLPSFTIKAANDAVLAVSQQPKQARKSSKRVTLTGVEQAQDLLYGMETK